MTRHRHSKTTVGLAIKTYDATKNFAAAARAAGNGVHPQTVRDWVKERGPAPAMIPGAPTGKAAMIMLEKSADGRWGYYIRAGELACEGAYVDTFGEALAGAVIQIRAVLEPRA